MAMLIEKSAPRAYLEVLRQLLLDLPGQRIGRGAARCKEAKGFEMEFECRWRVRHPPEAHESNGDDLNERVLLAGWHGGSACAHERALYELACSTSAPRQAYGKTAKC